LAFAALVLLSLTAVEAAEIRSANCKKIFKDFKKSAPISAFALSKNGLACGRLFGFSDTEAASKRASWMIGVKVRYASENRNHMARLICTYPLQTGSLAF